MNIVFFGTPDIAVSCLNDIALSAHTICGVVTVCDRPQGRHMHVTPSPVKMAAEQHEYPLYQFENINSPESIDTLKSLKPDLFIIVSFGKILCDALIQVPSMGALNIHMSYLPKFRGATPIQRALSEGFTRTGITVFYIEKKLDAGDIVLQEYVDIGRYDTYQSLYERFARMSGPFVLRALDMIERGQSKRVKQDDVDATYAHKFSKDEQLITWDKPARDIFNVVRALYPKPCAHTYFKIHGKYELIKIHKVTYDDIVNDDASAVPGQIIDVTKNNIAVKTGHGVISLKTLQVPGKKPMDVSTFLNGYKVACGEQFRKEI
ncbi:MAG: methionyl-tRNA formyltransferase [Candidatus Ancaeobacter aquaticus]|nr:methionyl-tRNA formyltransferase [Candidatus Ancaeobacter aquaticus]